MLSELACVGIIGILWEEKNIGENHCSIGATGAVEKKNIKSIIALSGQYKPG